jgi:hypothetical protein
MQSKPVVYLASAIDPGSILHVLLPSGKNQQVFDFFSFSFQSPSGFLTPAYLLNFIMGKIRRTDTNLLLLYELVYESKRNRQICSIYLVKFPFIV